MSPRVPASAALPPADPAFDLLVDGLIARLQAGEAVDWQAAAREHPEYAGRLRSLAPALQALGDLVVRDDGHPGEPDRPAVRDRGPPHQL